MDAGCVDAAAPNAYEEARLRRIADNKQKLAALGLAHGAARVGAPCSGTGPIAGATLGATRRCALLRGCFAARAHAQRAAPARLRALACCGGHAPR
jgi:hypothetical protein